MPVLSIPFVFTNGTIADGTQVDADFNTVQNVVNGLDFANVGVAGFYASQLIPTTGAQATFGGTQNYTFPAGIVTAQSTLLQGALGLQLTGANYSTTYTGFALSGVRPTLSLNATGTGGQNWQFISGDSGGFTPGSLVFFNAATSVGMTLLNNGNLGVQGALNVGPGTAVAGVAGDGAFYRNTTQGLLSLGGSSSNVAIDWNISNSSQLTINKAMSIGGFMNVAGTLQAQRSGGTGLGFVPPTYTLTGGAVPATLHFVTGQVTASGTTTTLTLSGNAVFSAALTPYIYDLTGGTVITSGISLPANQVSWTSINGHTYNYVLFGW